jgi:hypothetical protein
LFSRVGKESKKMKSVVAVLAGFILIGALGFITDTALQSLGILPETGSARFKDWQSLLALTYHLGFVIVGGYLTARLAPNRPVAHAIALGVLGIGFSLLGLIAIVSGDLAPAWYGWALVVFSVPATWLGGRIFTARQSGG